MNWEAEKKIRIYLRVNSIVSICTPCIAVQVTYLVSDEVWRGGLVVSSHYWYGSCLTLVTTSTIHAYHAHYVNTSVRPAV